MLIIVDFNLSRIKWTNGELLEIQRVEPVGEVIRSAALCVKDSFAYLDLKQFYPVHSKKGYTLDLLFSDLVLKAIGSLDSLVECDSHHEAAFFFFELGLQQSVKYEKIVYNCKRVNFSGISEFLNLID